MLELFESEYCRGASRALDVNPSSVASVFADVEGHHLTPNGARGPSTAAYWLPFRAQQGSGITSDEFDRPGPGDIHYDNEYWFAARYSKGARCTSFEDASCCGLVDAPENTIH